MTRKDHSQARSPLGCPPAGHSYSTGVLRGEELFGHLPRNAQHS
jgi:hypothetical protein